VISFEFLVGDEAALLRDDEAAGAALSDRNARNDVVDATHLQLHPHKKKAKKKAKKKKKIIVNK
jgi:hypothetical protein